MIDHNQSHNQNHNQTPPSLLRTGYPFKSGIKAKEFLSIEKYVNANAWADRLMAREQVRP